MSTTDSYALPLFASFFFFLNNPPPTKTSPLPHPAPLPIYNTITRRGGPPPGPRDVGPVIGVMILIRLELPHRAEAAQRAREALGIGDTGGGEDAPPAE